MTNQKQLTLLLTINMFLLSIESYITTNFLSNCQSLSYILNMSFTSIHVKRMMQT